MEVLAVKSPEGGKFAIASAFPVQIGRNVIANFDYGLDECVVAAAMDERDVVRPKWNLERIITPADEEVLKENAKLASGMAARFERISREKTPDFKVFSARLSFARKRIFMRYTSREARPDVSQAVAEMEKVFGVETHIWRATLKDEIATLGAIGYCGRACCCATWLNSSAAGRISSTNISECGACGKRRCCLDFEHEK